MRKGSKKSPIQKPRTKEEILREQNIARKRKFIIEDFYPALKEATESVEEASMLMGAATQIIMGEAMEMLKATKIKDVKARIVKVLCPNDERLLQIENLFSKFDDLSLFEARGHFESIKAVIEQMKMDEFSKRKLDTLTPEWGKYLH